MIQIAIYGKGGIGKSTMSANISYSLARMGKRVLQIGCDPKHDSTRALLGGRGQTTVLEYIKNTPPYDRRLEDVVLEGKMGIKCVEAGGPEPGIGCAGRGILSTFDTLKRLGMDDMDFDVKVYDVLGDVVCGGFAVPLRNEYADGVYLVTSGEFMSLYAANNILKGIKNFDKGIPRTAGIIANCRGMDRELEVIGRFARAVSLPVIAAIPRSGLFAEAEARGMPVAELFPDSDAAAELGKISAHVASLLGNPSLLLDSKPLTDEQMGRLAAGEEVRPNEGGAAPGGPSCGGCARKKALIDAKSRPLVASCAAAGAVYACSSVRDAVTVIHGPRSCAHIMSSSRNLSEIRRGRRRRGMSDPQFSRMCSTEMDDTISVFGGAGLLEEKLNDLILEGHRNFFIVTTCVSGIIGDNAIDVVNAISNAHPDLYFRVIEADGNIRGDWEDGYIEAADAIADMIRGDVEPSPDCVNLVGERYFFRANEEKEDEAPEMFRKFGIKVNCRLIHDCDMESVANFRRGRMNFIVNDDTGARGLAKALGGRHGIKIEERLLPYGMHEFREFAEMIGREFGREDLAREVLAREEGEYLAEIAAHRKSLEGRTAAVESWYPNSIDWVLDLLQDLGMRVMFVGIGPERHFRDVRKPSRHEGRLRFITDYSRERFDEETKGEKPDIVISDGMRGDVEGTRHTAFMVRAGVGVRCTLRLAAEIDTLMRLPAVEGWREYAKSDDRMEDERYAS
ncbi:MAG: AAA family ATPase [Candidatus Methanoplasma sp.]|jgi:nitrogenase iron protein|nr:AAA family ATPase [Candidatus Methanoplasma sp.]